jgi:hypothetical protein
MPPGLGMQGGTLQNIPPNASREQQMASLNDVINRLNALTKSIVFSDGQNKRMLIGYQKNGWGDGKDFGIKISIDGVDVSKASDSQLLFKMDMQTWFFYNPDDSNHNVMQLGILPDGKGGIAVAKTGNDVEDAFS